MIVRFILALILAHYIVPLYKFVLNGEAIPGSTAVWACLFTVWYFIQLLYFTIREEEDDK